MKVDQIKLHKFPGMISIIIFLLFLMSCSDNSDSSSSDAATIATDSLPEQIEVTGTLQIAENSGEGESAIQTQETAGQPVQLTDTSGNIVSTGTVSSTAGTFTLAIETNGLSLTDGGFSGSTQTVLFVSSLFLDKNADGDEGDAIGAKNQITISADKLAASGENNKPQFQAGTITADKVGAIVGQIVLASNEDPTGIDVYIPGTTHLAKTDAKGQFIMGFLPPGQYTLRADKDGFGSIEWEANVKRKQTVKLLKATMKISDGPAIEEFSLIGGGSISLISQVTLKLKTKGASRFRISQLSDFRDASFRVIDASLEYMEVPFQINGGDGNKEIFLEIIDSDGLSAKTSLTMLLDTKIPEVPEFFIASPKIDGPQGLFELAVPGYSSQLSPNLVVSDCNDAENLFLTEENFHNPIAGGESYGADIYTQIEKFTIRCSEALKGVSVALSQQEGSKSVYLWSMDAAGQISASGKNYQVIVDTTNPSLSIMPAANQGDDSTYANESITIVVTPSEQTSKVYYTTDLSTPTVHASELPLFTKKNENGSVTYEGQLVLIGNGTFKFLAVDFSGNRSQVITRKFFINRSGPILGSISTTSNLVNTTTFPLYLSVQKASRVKISESINELLAQDWIAWNGLSNAPTQMILNYELKNTNDGTKTLYALFGDDYGNMIGQGGEFSTTIILDRTAPSSGKIALLQPESPTGAFNTPLAWTSDFDADADVTFKVLVYSSSDTTADPIRTMTTKKTSTTITPPLSSPGTYYWGVKAVDSAQNETALVFSGTEKKFSVQVLAQSYQAKADHNGNAATDRAFAKELVLIGDYTGDGQPEIAYSVLQTDFTSENGTCQGCGLVQIYDRAQDQIIGSLEEGLSKSENFGHRIIKCDLNGDGRDEIIVAAPNEGIEVGNTLYKQAGAIYAYEFDGAYFQLLGSQKADLSAGSPAYAYNNCNQYEGSDCVQYGWDFWPDSIDYSLWYGDKRLFGWDISCVRGDSGATNNGNDAVLVGEPYYHNGTYLKGKVSQFEFNGGTFSETKTVYGPDTDDTAFGAAVQYLGVFKYGSCSTAGPTIAVGQPSKVVNGDRRGSVSLYQISSGTWTLCDTIDAANDDLNGGNFGQRLSNLGNIDKDVSDIEELAISSQSWSGGAVRIYGGASGALLKSYRDTSSYDLNMLGYTVVPAGDFNSDGQSDLALTIPGAKVNGQWDAGKVLILDWTTLDSSDNTTGTVLRTITGKPENGARLGASFIPILADQNDMHSVTQETIINKPGRNIDGNWGIGSFHEFSLIKIAPSLPFKITGTSSNAKFGHAIAATPDVDGDSVSDFFIGQPGGLCNGTPYGAVSLYSVLDGRININYCGDYDNDLGRHVQWLTNASDLIFSDKWTAYGLDYWSMSNNDYWNVNDFTYYPSSRRMSVSDSKSSISYARKVTSNQEELLVTNGNYWGSAEGEGSVTLTFYDWQFNTQCYYRGDVEKGYFGTSASFINDINGDGKREIVIGAPGQDINSATGRVYIIDGSSAVGDCESQNSLIINPTSPLTLFTIDADDTAIVSALGKAANDQFGSLVLGLPDFDGSGDAVAYLYIANNNMEHGSSSVIPQYFIFRINSDQSITLMKHETGLAGGMLGGSAKVLEDINGDSYQELAISYPGGIGRLGNTGHVQILSGSALSTTATSDDLMQMLYNPEPSGNNFGISIEYGDITGDSLKDFVVGGDEYDAGPFQNAGAIFVFPMEPIKE